MWGGVQSVLSKSKGTLRYIPGSPWGPFCPPTLVCFCHAFPSGREGKVHTGMSYDHPHIVGLWNEWGPPSCYGKIHIHWGLTMVPSYPSNFLQCHKFFLKPFFYPYFPTVPPPSPTSAMLSIIDGCGVIWTLFSIGLLIFDWCMVMWRLKNKHHKDTCVKEIKLHLQVFWITLHSIMNTQ